MSWPSTECNSIIWDVSSIHRNKEYPPGLHLRWLYDRLNFAEDSFSSYIFSGFALQQEFLKYYGVPPYCLPPESSQTVPQASPSSSPPSSGGSFSSSRNVPASIGAYHIRSLLLRHSQCASISLRCHHVLVQFDPPLLPVILDSIKTGNVMLYLDLTR